jgi:dTMP kinase
MYQTGTARSVNLQEFARPLGQEAHSYEGRLVTFDGVDGSGKTTLISGLVDELRHRGIKANGIDMMSSWVRKHPQFVELTSDLASVTHKRADITAICAICIGDRLAGWRTQFNKLLAEGEWLMVDRYHLTPMADMLVLGSERPDQSMVRSLLSLLPRPDWAFLTHVESEIALERVQSRPEEAKRIQRPALTCQLVVAFHRLAEVHGAYVVDTSKGIPEAVNCAINFLGL